MDPTEVPVRSVSKLPLWIMTGVVAFAVLLIVALVVARGNAAFEPGTPEATVQQFLIAELEDRDNETMGTLLTPRARAQCSEELDDRRSPYSSNQRATLEDVSIDGDTAEIKVELRRGATDPFDGSGSYGNRRSLRLERIDGEWLIDEVDYPYWLSNCTDQPG